MLVAFIIFFVVFVILGVLTFLGKTATFVTGGKTDENGEPMYDEKGISRFLGIIMCLLAASALMGALGYLIPSLSWMVICAPILFIAVMLFALVYINTDGRFKVNGGGKRYKK